MTCPWHLRTFWNGELWVLGVEGGVEIEVEVKWCAWYFQVYVKGG